MPDKKTVKVVKKTTNKRINPTLKSDRMGGTPNTSTYKRSKMSISNELMSRNKKGVSKTRTRSPKGYSKSIKTNKI